MNMTTARAISAMVRAMPPLDSGPRERLAWLEPEARIFDEATAEDAIIVADATSYAVAARKQADALRPALGDPAGEQA